MKALMQLHKISLAAALIAVGTLVACGKSDPQPPPEMNEEIPPPLQSDATPPPDAPPVEDPLKPTYANIRKQIFEPKCASCHFAGGDAQFLRLDSLTAIRMYPNFVLKEVKDSVLIKMVTRKDVGRMPPPRNGPRLTKEEIEMLKAWIVAGAPE